MNLMIAKGRAVHDAVLDKVPVRGVDTPRCRFSLAVDDKKANGERFTTYFEITLWREYAVSMAPWIKQGREMVVVGQLRKNTYTKDGVEKTNLQIANPSIYLCGKKPAVEVVEDPDDMPF